MKTTIAVTQHTRITVEPQLGWVVLTIYEGGFGHHVSLSRDQAAALGFALEAADQAIETQRTREAAGPRASDLQQPATE